MNLSEETLALFRRHLESQGLSRCTEASYLSAVRQFYSRWPDLTAASLKRHREWLLERYRPSTVNARISALNHFLVFLAQQEEDQFQPDPEVPLLPAPREPDEAPYRLLSVRLQQRSFLDSIISEQDYEHLKACLLADGNMEWYFLVHFLGSTGVRVGELVRIKVEHLRLGFMDLYSKGGKVRRVYFPEALCEKANSWCREQGRTSGFLFLNRKGLPLTPRWINSRLKSLAVRYHIDPDTVYPHAFRHRFAKNFLKKFNDISLLADLMGHESIETTRIYLTQSSLEQQEEIDRIVTW